jgi:glutathione synthase/RimK-type ligase-like ATP-grasp enzyme
VRARIGVLGRAADPHAAAVARLAADAGAEVSLINTSQPSFARWGWREGRLHDHEQNPVELDAVYVRSVAAPVPRHEAPEVTAPLLRNWLHQAERRRRIQVHARAVHAGLEAAGTLMVNPVDATWFHRSKPAADLRLRAAGIPTPRCLVTDDPAAVRRFVATVGETVRKPIAGGGACVEVDPAATDDEDLRGLVAAPTLFQERIRGDDLRIYLVDGEVVVAAHIRTEALDYRGNEDDVVAFDPDDELVGLCRRVAATLGLVFTGIDVKRAADGALTVLDTNPSPMFLGIERRTGRPIGQPLVARLLAAATTATATVTSTVTTTEAPTHG